MSSIGVKLKSQLTWIKDRYEDLANEHYSRAMKELEKTHVELAAEANGAAQADFKNLTGLMNKSAQLHAPLLNEDVEYSACDIDGHHHTDTIQIREAIAAFEKRLGSATTSLERLWALWDEARVEIEALGDVNGSAHDDAEWNDHMKAIDEEIGTGTTALNIKLDELAEATVGEFKKQDKV